MFWTMPRRREGGEVSVSQAGDEGEPLISAKCFECFPCQCEPKHVAVSANAAVACAKQTCWVSIALHRVSRLMSVTDCEL